MAGNESGAAQAAMAGNESGAVKAAMAGGAVKAAMAGNESGAVKAAMAGNENVAIRAAMEGNDEIFPFDEVPEDIQGVIVPPLFRPFFSLFYLLIIVYLLFVSFSATLEEKEDVVILSHAFDNLLL